LCWSNMAASFAILPALVWRTWLATRVAETPTLLSTLPTLWSTLVATSAMPPGGRRRPAPGLPFEGGLGQLALGDVLNLGDEVKRLALAIADQRNI